MGEGGCSRGTGTPEARRGALAHGVASNPIKSGLDPIACVSTDPWGCWGCQARAGWTPKGFAILCHRGAGLQPPIPLDLGSPGRSGEPGGGDTAPSLGTGLDTEHLHHPGSWLCAERGRLRVPTTACVPIPAPWGPSPAGTEGCLDLGEGGSAGGCRGAGADPATAEPLAVSCLLAVPRSLGPASVCGAGDGVGPKSILSYRVSFLSCK